MAARSRRLDIGKRRSTALGLMVLAMAAALTLWWLAGARIAGSGSLPLPEPVGAPAPAAALHFPSNASPEMGCDAILGTSAAPAAPRSAVAGELTAELLQEASFDA
jgi:hypothetical protein